MEEGLADSVVQYEKKKRGLDQLQERKKGKGGDGAIVSYIEERELKT